MCLLGIHAQPSYWLDLGALSCGTLTSIRLLDLVPLLTKETYKKLLDLCRSHVPVLPIKDFECKHQHLSRLRFTSVESVTMANTKYRKGIHHYCLPQLLLLTSHRCLHYANYLVVCQLCTQFLPAIYFDYK